MHLYRSHNCGALRLSDAGQVVRLSGWIHRKRDHGQLLFVDLRDSFGLTQCVIDVSSPLFPVLEGARLESVLTVTGPVVRRADETINATLATGEVEVKIEAAELQSRAEMLPLQVNSDEDAGEEFRLRYRYLDLRREKMQRKIRLRSAVISSIRRRMIEQGFMEFQTPILTASSPEGARDYLVPSRLHPGKFYALPQAPQMFKQLLMVAGFDRYFQIAPCFRDEDSRADRSPGEFYQLDFEMSFVTQDDVFEAIEPVLSGVFEEFAEGRQVSAAPFVRIPFEDRDAAVRQRQAGPAQPHRDQRCDPRLSAAQVSVSSPVPSTTEPWCAAIPAPGAAARPAQFLRQAERLGPCRGSGGARLRNLRRRRRRQGTNRQEP